MKKTKDPDQTALRKLSDLGYKVTEREGIWAAEAGALRLMANDPVALLGLHGILDARGWAWATRSGEPNLYEELLDADTKAPAT